eukprot:1517278-Pyramimonas_sp.AAC.1
MSNIFTARRLCFLAGKCNHEPVAFTTFYFGYHFAEESWLDQYLDLQLFMPKDPAEGRRLLP